MNFFKYVLPIILECIVFYLINTFFIAKKDIEKYEKKEAYTQKDLDMYKKYVHLKSISMTIMFLGVIIGIRICDYYNANNMFLKTIVTVGIGSIFGILSSAYIDKKYKNIKN